MPNDLNAKKDRWQVSDELELAASPIAHSDECCAISYAAERAQCFCTKSARITVADPALLIRYEVEIEMNIVCSAALFRCH